MLSITYEGNNNSIDLINNPNLVIMSYDGLNQPTAEIVSFSNPNLRGTQYHRSSIQDRQISFTFYVYNVESTRYRLMDIFKSGEKGTLILQNEFRTGKIECYFEEMIWDRFQMLTTCQIFLRAPFPYFEGLQEIIMELTNATNAFVLETYIPVGEDIIFGEITSEHQGIAYNDGDIPVGVTIRITAFEDILNPIIYNITTNKFIGINGTIYQGETLIITTSVGNKRVYVENTDRPNSNIINSLRVGSTFFELNRGENTIRCDAETGGETMLVYIGYNDCYEAI